MKSSSKASKHIHRVVAYALFVGSIAAPFAAQTAYALPIEGANAATNKTEADISTSGAVMDITGKSSHNILRWEDFSIEQNEKVRFDGGGKTRDYLNLVTGEGASNIYGTIEGGRNVYLVNPHGILFAKDSQVNTGALYLSTAKPNDLTAATNTFKANGTSPLSATAQTGDVLNLGAVKAAKLYIEGNNVTVLNTDAVKDANGAALTGSAVTIRSEETPHIGYDVGNRVTMNIDVNGAATPYQVFDYASTNADHHKASASARGWDVADLGGTAHTDYDYMRVHTVYDLQNINAKLDGRYILAGDIDAGVTNTWNSTVHGIEGFLPIGENVSTNFTGRFDGAGHTLRGLYIKRMYGRNEDIALFGYAVRAHIENLSLVDAYVEGTNNVGGIVGYADRPVIRNVSYAGRVVGNNAVGGIEGYAWGGSIQNAWNTGEVRGSYPVGGIAGIVIDSAVIQNVCNTGAITGNERVGGIVGAILNSTLQNAWNTGTVAGSQKVGGIVGEAARGTVRHAVWKAGSAGQAVGSSIGGADVTDVKVAAEADMKLAATYTSWQDEHGKALVATEGGKGTPWRIYEGHTTPLLTALMKGTKRLEKTYDGKTFGDGDAHILSDTPLQKNVGTYDARGIYSDTFGYDLIGSTYRIAPRVLTMSGVASQTKTYDGNTNADATQFHATLNNVVTGEESLVTATARGAAYNSKNVATASKVTYTGLALTGTGAANYTVATTAEGAGTITARALTLGAVAAQTKTYDGTTAADASKFSAGLNNTVAGDSVTATATGAAYNSKDVAGANTVNYTGVALGGADAGNYSLAAGAAQGTGSITQRALTLGTVAAQSKTYDGTTAADTATFRATLDNVVAGEESSVTATATGAAYNDKTVAGANKVSYTGVALQGTGAGNYSLAATTAEGVGTIAKRALTVGTVTAQTKTYDGTTAADAAEFQATLGNLVAGEESSVAATAMGAAYNDKNVAGANRIDYTGIALTGTGAANYTVADTAQGAGTITKRALTLGEVTAQTKTYDGTTAADASKFRAALGNTIAGDNVTAAAATATFNDKNVAAANRIDYTGVALAGADAGNYTLAATMAQGAGTITPRTLTVGTVAAQTKTYDGTTAADAAAFRATLGNLVAGEESSVAATAAGAAYNDKNVAAANAVSYTGVALTGTGAGNYSLAAATAQGAGTITKRALTLGEVTAQTKTYDGTRAADTSKFRATLNNVVSGEENLVAASAAGATYNNKNVAAANKVSYTGLALTGTGAGNYTVANTAEGAGSITKRALTVGTVAAQTKTYDGTTAADAAQFHATLNNVVTGEENSVTATAAGAAYNDKNVAGANRIDYTGVALTGTGAANYTIATTAEGAGTITQRALTLGEVESQSKTYDGTTAADASKFRATLGNTIAGDSVTAAATTATFNDKNVAAANRIDYTGVALAGADAGNYSLAATTAQSAGTITRRTLTVGAVTAQTKTYDGTTAADASQFHATLNNVVAGEENLVAATAAGAAYNDKNVAGANAVGYTGVALTGTGAGNYAIADTAQGAGTITQRALTLGTVAAQTKTYDGTTAADASKFRATLGNTIAGDSVSTTATGAAYNDKNVAAANRIDYTGVALAGADAGNYSLAATTAQSAGTITRRALTVDTVAAQSKTYDGNTSADTSKFHATLGNFVAGEEGSATATAAGATYNDKNVAGASTVGYTGVALRGADAANYSLAATTAQGAGSITHRTLTLTAAPQSVVQGEALPSFTGRADGFADGEDASVFGADGITFGTAANTDTPGSYGITGRIGSITGGVLGNYRIMQAAGNATAFTVHAALPNGILAALVQDAAPRFDTGFDPEVYVFGLPRPISAATLGFYRFTPARDLGIEGLRLD